MKLFSSKHDRLVLYTHEPIALTPNHPLCQLPATRDLNCTASGYERTMHFPSAFRGAVCVNRTTEDDICRSIPSFFYQEPAGCFKAAIGQLALADAGHHSERAGEWLEARGVIISGPACAEGSPSCAGCRAAGGGGGGCIVGSRDWFRTVVSNHGFAACCEVVLEWQ